MGLTVPSVRSGARDVRHAAAAYAELVRVPNLFTAPPDVLAGAALSVAAGATVPVPALAGAAVASALLYAGGTTLNDYADAPVDATERPRRPIPSGRVPRRVAGALGVGLLASGVLVAALVAGPDAAVTALALAVVVVAYDALLADGPVGFIAMGTARGMNVLLGVTVASIALPSLPAWAFAVPVAVAGYVAAVTAMAEGEVTGGDRRAVVVAGVGAGLAGLLPLALLATVGTGGTLAAAVTVAFALGFLALTGRALGRAYRDPAAERVGAAVGTCVLALVVLDAAVAGVAGLPWSATALAFALPAVGLSRAFDVS